MSKHDLNFMRDEFAREGLILSEQQEESLIRYYELLIDWNKQINLTAITDFREVISKHFLDSLMIRKTGYLRGDEKTIDVGTGAGFPGIPLAIAFPGMSVTLLDSLRKRTDFLNVCREELKLENVRILQSRAEDAARKEDFREAFDLSVSRAVAALPVLSEYCLPFVKVGGLFISYKSQKAEEEIRQTEHALSSLGGEILDQKKYILSDTGADRTLVIIKKDRPTPDKYPRKAGIPSKKPLL